MSILPRSIHLGILLAAAASHTSFIPAGMAEPAGVIGKVSPTQTPAHFRVPVQVSGVPSSLNVPLFAGIPFPKDWHLGALAVVDENGTRIPSSTRIMARWPESNAVRWAGVDFIGKPGERYYVVPPLGAPANGVSKVVVIEEKNAFVMVTGPAKFVIPKKGALIGQAYLDKNNDGKFSPTELLLENNAGDDLYVIDQENNRADIGSDSDDNQLRFETGEEERGANEPILRAVLRREGWYVTSSGEKIARHITRLHFYGGRAEVKVEHRLVLTDNTNRRWFKDYGLRLKYSQAAKPNQVAMPESEKADAPVITTSLSPIDREVYLFQEKAFYLSRTDLQEDCRFRIGKIASNGDEQNLKSGPLAGNWMLVGNRNMGIGVVLKNLWQTYPKEISTTLEAMTVHLWSPRGGAELDFRSDTIIDSWPKEWFNEEGANRALINRIKKIDSNAMGLSRSHDLVISLCGEPDAKAMAGLAARVQTPDVCLADPAWLRFTEAMGKIHPYDPARFPDAEAFMQEWFDQHLKIWRQWGDYGFFEFGNWPHVWYRKATKGPLVGRWHPYVDRYSALMDYGFYAHIWRAFVRTGDRKYFDAADEVTRQRLDMTMAHWDESKPGEPLRLDRYGNPPRRLKGTYTFSNSPICWAGSSRFHHNSGTDIRALAYLYYLTDHRAAKEMIVSYGEAVKRIWNPAKPPFRGTRPFATLKNLATVYQETGEPVFKEITLELLQWLVDLDAPQGVSMEKETTKLGKYGVKAGAIERVQEIMPNDLAAKSLVRGATTRAAMSMGEDPFSYFNVEGEQLAGAFRLTRDPVFVRALRRDMEVAISEYRDRENGNWLSMWRGSTLSTSNNVYPLGGMAFAMDAIAEHEAATGQKVELTPFVRQSGFGRVTLAAFEKPKGERINLDVRSNRTLAPVIYDSAGKPVSGVEMKPWRDQLHSRTAAATRWEISLAESLAEGTYFLDSGGNGAMWEITWTNAPHAVLYSPGGFLLGPGGRQWGNRIMAGDSDHNEPAYFFVPEDCKAFEVLTTQACQLKTPDGSEVAVGTKRGAWQSVPVPETHRGKLWSIFAPEVSFIEFREIPPFMAYGEADRFFLPKIGADTLAKLPGVHLPPIGNLNPGGNPFFEINAPAGQPGQGILLTGKRRLKIPSDSLIQADQGTIEFWLMPCWRSVDQLTLKSPRTLLDAGPWQILLHRHGEMSVTAMVDADKRVSTASETNEGDDEKPASSSRALETNAGVTLEEGLWTHLALQWRQEEGEFHWELFVNGKKQTFGIDNAGMPAIAKGFVPGTPAEELIFGGTRTGKQHLDAGLAGLRFSNTARYQESFDPVLTPTLQSDAHTTGLFLFEEGQTGAGQLINP